MTGFTKFHKFPFTSRFIFAVLSMFVLLFTGVAFASSGMLFDVKEVAGIRYVFVGSQFGVNASNFLPRDPEAQGQAQPSEAFPDLLAVKELFADSNVVVLPRSSDDAHAVIRKGETYLTLTFTRSVQQAEYDGKKIPVAALTMGLKRSSKDIALGKWTHSIIPAPNFAYPFIIYGDVKSYRAQIKEGVKSLISYLPEYVATPISSLNQQR